MVYMKFKIRIIYFNVNFELIIGVFYVYFIYDYIFKYFWGYLSVRFVCKVLLFIKEFILYIFKYFVGSR